MYDRFHLKCHTLAIHQILKNKLLDTNSNQSKISLWICTTKHRGIWVFDLVDFWGVVFPVGIVIHIYIRWWILSRSLARSRTYAERYSNMCVGSISLCKSLCKCPSFYICFYICRKTSFYTRRNICRKMDICRERNICRKMDICRLSIYVKRWTFADRNLMVDHTSLALGHITHKSIWINKSSVNPQSTSNQSSKPCTVLQYPSRKVGHMSLALVHMQRDSYTCRERASDV